MRPLAAFSLLNTYDPDSQLEAEDEPRVIASNQPAPRIHGQITCTVAAIDAALLQLKRPGKPSGERRD